MSNIIESNDVFTFMGSTADINDTQNNAMTELITTMQSDLEKDLGRKVVKSTATDLLLQDGLNCAIFKEKLYLKGEFRDMYSISALVETSQALTASTGYNNGGDFYHDIRKGVIIRINDSWSLEQLALKMSGSYGLINTSEEVPLEAIRLILINSVAAKSGQWKFKVLSDGVEVESIRTSIPADVKKMKKRYTLRDF